MAKSMCLICKAAPAVSGLKSKFARVKIGKLMFSKLKKKAKSVQRCYPCEADMTLANQFDVSLKKLPETLKEFNKSSHKKFGQHWKPEPPPKAAGAAYREPRGVVLGTCKRCKKPKRKLQDWLWRQTGPQQLLWCRKCSKEKFLIQLHNSAIWWKKELKRLEALEAQRKELGLKTRGRNRSLAKTAFKRIKYVRSLATEGNVPLMKRLLKEGKKFKELIKIYTELYKARGQTNAAWIRGRVKAYRRVVRGG